MTTLQDVAAWKNVAFDPSTIATTPIKVQGISPVDHDVVIRLLITREHADYFFHSGLFRGHDVLITSATCWNSATDEQIPVDDSLYTAHLVALLSEAHAIAAFPYNIGSPTTRYRLILVGEDQKPQRPTPLQLTHLLASQV